jgi:NADH:ubiquinone oxidoreductase subunit 5 (subunit L)/multisubunit Na+/H+ antiporter MnhA subunit
VPDYDRNPDVGGMERTEKEYRELYMDLMGGAVAGSRLVASDVSGDGFAAKPKRDVPPDSWERNNKTQMFEGSRKAKLSDELYDKAIVRPIKRISTTVLWRGVDAGLIDGSVNAVGLVVRGWSAVLRRMQTGSVRAYAMSFFVGVVALLGYYLWQ